MVLPRCVHNDTTILGAEQPEFALITQKVEGANLPPCPTGLRAAALTAGLARPAELFAAGQTRPGAGFVDAVVAQEERVGGAWLRQPAERRNTESGKPMADYVRAVFEHGTFVPETPCDLPEGTQVLLAVHSRTAVSPPEVKGPQRAGPDSARRRRTHAAESPANECEPVRQGRDA